MSVNKTSTLWDELDPVDIDKPKLEHLFESRSKDLITKVGHFNFLNLVFFSFFSFSFSLSGLITYNCNVRKIAMIFYDFNRIELAVSGPYSELGLTLKPLWFQSIFRAVLEQF